MVLNTKTSKNSIIIKIVFHLLHWDKGCFTLLFVDKIKKKAVRTITYSNYIAHSEPLLKELNLLKVKDLFELKVL